MPRGGYIPTNNVGTYDGHPRFPDARPEELRRRLASLLLGRELETKVYGPEPGPSTIR